MTDSIHDGSRAQPRGMYFFLSYGHVTPTFRPDGIEADPDRWVTIFFQDLSAAVRRHAGLPGTTEVGFYDQTVPMGVDWKAALTDALSDAETFVPLYSPAYFNLPLPQGERESFRRRVAASGADHSFDHIVPVLWTPLPSWDPVPELSVALDLSDGVSAYVENGMRALCMLGPYRSEYLTMVDRLARRIVDVASRAPLPATRAPAVSLTTTLPTTDTPFVVGVLAPTAGTVPADRIADSYGVRSRLWRPFVDAPNLSVAEYASNVAEGLGLPTRIIDFSTERAQLEARPGMVLVDPWILAQKDGATALATLDDTLRPWVSVLLVADVHDAQYDQRGAELCEEVVDMLGRAGVPLVARAGTFSDFRRSMPRLVTQVQRRYLRYATVYPPQGSSVPRPRFSGYDPYQPEEQSDV